jgi:hypothetical protein
MSAAIIITIVTTVFNPPNRLQGGRPSATAVFFILKKQIKNVKIDIAYAKTFSKSMGHYVGFNQWSFNSFNLRIFVF